MNQPTAGGAQLSSFEAAFGGAPTAVADAPGRVNLLGEHTDYNDGYVLPIAIAQRTTVSLRMKSDEPFELAAADLGRRAQFVLGERPDEPFARYVYGCLMEAQSLRPAQPLPPLQIHVHSEVPMGVGLSSSAALEVATLRALRALLQAPWDDVQVAQLAQRAEVLHAGVRCGLMDQLASSLAGTTQALFLDTRTLERRLVPLPAGSAVLVLDSGLPRALAESGYNQRREECERAAQLLGERSLRDVAPTANLGGLPKPLGRRARHVLSENARVLAALRGLDAPAFGALMNASHASLRDDFEVSVPGLDRLVALLQAQPGVYGARLTGAGFGGACVALCDEARLPRVSADVIAAYAAAGGQGRQLVP